MINFLKIFHAKTIVSVEEMKNIMLYLELTIFESVFSTTTFLYIEMAT